jgi:hypothetical protein
LQARSLQWTENMPALPWELWSASLPSLVPAWLGAGKTLHLIPPHVHVAYSIRLVGFLSGFMTGSRRPVFMMLWWLRNAVQAGAHGQGRLVHFCFEDTAVETQSSGVVRA